MRAALDIALKVPQAADRDRSALLIGIVAPFTLAVLFAVMLGGVEDGFQARWVVVDLDGGDVASGSARWAHRGRRAGWCRERSAGARRRRGARGHR